VIRILAIPVAGTVAALLAILAFHREREVPGPGVRPPPPFELPTPDEPEGPDGMPEGPHPDDVRPPPEPSPQPRTYRLQLRADGVLVDLESGETFQDAAEALEMLAADEGVRNRVMLGNATPEVDEAALDAVVAALAERCDVRKVYRGPAKDGG